VKQLGDSKSIEECSAEKSRTLRLFLGLGGYVQILVKMLNVKPNRLDDERGVAAEDELCVGVVQKEEPPKRPQDGELECQIVVLDEDNVQRTVSAADGKTTCGESDGAMRLQRRRIDTS
jgi:hypothetical protein